MYDYGVCERENYHGDAEWEASGEYSENFQSLFG